MDKDGGLFMFSPYQFIEQWYTFLTNYPNEDILYLFYEDIVENKKENVTVELKDFCSYFQKKILDVFLNLNIYK